MNTPKIEVNPINERITIVKKLYAKKSMDINFKNKNKRAIALKRKKESLIFASLISEAKMQL